MPARSSISCNMLFSSWPTNQSTTRLAPTCSNSRICLAERHWPSSANTLLVPPQADTYNFQLHAPLAKWQQIGAYESAAECDQALASVQLLESNPQFTANQRKAVRLAK